MDLSIIIPYAGEFPTLVFTVASIYEELRGHDIEFEIMVIDNNCKELRAQGFDDDRSRKAIEAAAQLHPWLKSLEFRDYLSCWQARNLGSQSSSGRVLWFCDAHCIVPSGMLLGMYRYYAEHHEQLDGSLHLANTYQILEKRPDMYKLKPELDRGFIGYSLTPYRHQESPYEVPCASSCGMMITRKLWNLLGGYPQHYAYSGGEHFINFVQATMGKKKWIYTGGFLRHHGARRDYHFTHYGLVWNQCASMYMIGGRALAEKYIKHKEGQPQRLKEILANVLYRCQVQRERIKALQTVDIYDWASDWEQRLKEAA